MNQDEFERWLQEQAGRLPRELEPGRDLWPEIAERIARADSPVAARRMHAPRGVYALAASAALLALAALFVAVLPREAPSGPTMVTGGTMLDPGAWPPGVVEVRNSMLTDFDANLANLSPRTRQVVEENMKKIHESLAAIHAALAEDPGNTTLHGLLMSTYQEELNLMSEIAKIKATSTEL
jgi:hypothetical protein